jgi:mono/diheme cytochrome c family protein
VASRPWWTSSRSLDKEKTDGLEKEMRVMRRPERQAEASAMQRMYRSTIQTGWMKSFVVLSLFIFAALLFGFPVAKARQSSDAPPAGNAQNGKKLFVGDGCYECHGREGQGSAQTGATRIGPPQLSFEGFQNYVRKPTNQMPPYTSKAIPDQDLADIYAYLKSIPMPPKGKDIPLLNK